MTTLANIAIVLFCAVAILALVRFLREELRRGEEPLRHRDEWFLFGRKL